MYQNIVAPASTTHIQARADQAICILVQFLLYSSDQTLTELKKSAAISQAIPPFPFHPWSSTDCCSPGRPMDSTEEGMHL